MAIQRRMHLQHGDVFPAGAYLVGPVEPVADFDQPQLADKSRPQKLDKETGLPVWTVPVLDADPEAGKKDKTVNVKILAKHQPVPPENTTGLPFVPVEFLGLSALAYVEYPGGKNKEGQDRTRIVWTFSALEMAAPGQGKTGGNGATGSKAAA